MAGTEEKNQIIKENRDRLNEAQVEWCLRGEVIPMQSPRLWCRYYRLMGRNAKADMIEKALEITGTDHGGHFICLNLS